MKHFRLLIITVISFCAVQTAAEENLGILVKFPKGLPAEKEKLLIDRMTVTADAVRSGSYGVLQNLWNYPPCVADGGFEFCFSCIRDAEKNADGKRKIVGTQISICQVNDQLVQEGSFGSGVVNGAWLTFHHTGKLVSFYEGNYILGGGNNTITARFSANTGLASVLDLTFEGEESSKKRISRVYKELFDPKNAPIAPVKRVSYTWDEKEKLAVRGNPALIERLNPQVYAKNKDAQHKKVDWGKEPQIPQLKNDKELQPFFSRMKKMMSANKYDDFVTLIDEVPTEFFAQRGETQPISRSGSVFTIRQWKCRNMLVHGMLDSKNKPDAAASIAFAFAKDAAGMPSLYLEGNVDSIKLYELEPSLSNYGGGVEVRFHANGMPKNYRSLVRGRLFGRQIKWDEKGKIISDVDLDEPVVPPEIQKALGEEKKNTSPPANAGGS